LPYILNLECKNLAKLLATVPFLKDKLSMMTKYIPLTIDLKQNNATLLESFPVFDKEDAQKIIDAWTTGSKSTIPCLFGYGIRAKRVTIVVDYSFSMGRNITNEGRVLTMLQFVKEQLNLALDVMTDDQEFNLIYFAGLDGVLPWRSQGVVPHNAQNVHDAKATGHRSIAALKLGIKYPYRYTWQAMYRATTDPNSNAIFLLSDGEPPSHQQDIINMAFKYSQSTDSKGSPRFITAVAFNANATAVSFMTEVAKAGNGTFRNLK